MYSVLLQQPPLVSFPCPLTLTTSVHLCPTSGTCISLPGASLCHLYGWKYGKLMPHPHHTHTTSFNQWLEYIITPDPLSPWGEATLTCSLYTRSQNSPEGSVLVTYSGNLFNNERFICSLFFSVSFPRFSYPHFLGLTSK